MTQELLLVDTDGDGPQTNGLVRAFASSDVVKSTWSATLSEEVISAGMAVAFGTDAENVFLGGIQVAVSTKVELDTPLPAPSSDGAHYLHLTDVDHGVGQTQTPGRLSLGFFGIDDIAFSTVGGIEAEFDADASRPAQFIIRSGFGGIADPAKSIDVAFNVLDVPQQLSLSTNMGSRFDYTASGGIDAITASGVIDHKDDGLLNFRIINGLLDLDGDGSISGADSGHIGQHVVVAGQINIDPSSDAADGSELVDAGDDGSIGDVFIVDGLIDVDESGVVDAADDRSPNGTELLFGLVNLPSQIRLRAAPAAVGITAGLLNLNGDDAIDGKDDGDFGGVAVINGALDLNGDGVVDADDDGEHLGRTVIDGKVDLNDDDVVDDDDKGQWFGVQLNMSGPIDALELLQRSQSDELAVMSDKAEGNRIMHVQLSDLPGNLLLASYGLSFDLENTSDNGFVFESTDADGNAAPIGSLSLLAATSQNPATIAEMRRAFQQTSSGPTGEVLDGSTPSRINYSPYLQSIDSAYYEAGDGEQILARLESLYAQGAVLDTANDHVAIRNAGGKQILMDVLLRGFQEASASYKVVDNPVDPTLFKIIDEAELTFRAPFEGTHPFYFGIANSDGEVDGTDDGFFAGRSVINGKLDMNGDGVIDAADNGFVFGHKVIKGLIDLNGDNTVDYADDEENLDDGLLRGIRVIDGRLDVSEQLLSLDIENLPDAIDFDISYEEKYLGYDADDDTDPSPGDIDVYSGTVTVAPDDTPAFRLRLSDTPEFVDVTWDAALLNGGINIDGADTFEAAFLLQTPMIGGDMARFVGGLRMEELQFGYDLEFFSFEVVKEFFVPIGDRITDGRIDVNGDGVINNQDDGERDGKTIINGFVDIDDDGDIDGDDDGSILLFQWTGTVPFLETRAVINGGIDQNGNDAVGGGDDYDNRFFVFPTAWELFSATVGIDNNAESTDIQEDPDNASISGFFNVYQLKQNPVALDGSVHTDAPAAQSAEYLPFISTVLDEFRELSYGLDIVLDPLSLEKVTSTAGPTLPAGTTFVFDVWAHDLFEFEPPLIDFPDDMEIAGIVIDFPDDIQTGVRIGRDYIDNSPLHLFPMTTLSLTFDDFILTDINLHLFGDHEDPFL